MRTTKKRKVYKAEFKAKVALEAALIIPHAKLIRKLGLLSFEQMKAVEEKVRFWLGL